MKVPDSDHRPEDYEFQAVICVKVSGTATNKTDKTDANNLPILCSKSVTKLNECKQTEKKTDFRNSKKRIDGLKAIMVDTSLINLTQFEKTGSIGKLFTSPGNLILNFRN